MFSFLNELFYFSKVVWEFIRATGRSEIRMSLGEIFMVCFVLLDVDPDSK